MSFGHKGATGAVRVYVYGVSRAALRQHGGERLDLAVEQMRRRTALWNRLVEIDRAIRAEQEPWLAPYRAQEGQPRQPLPPEARAAVRAIEERYRVEINAACRESGCFWPNYGEVKIAWQAARKRPGELRFHRWDGSGRVAVSLSPPLSVAEAWAGTNMWVRIRPRGQRDGDVWVDLRIGSAGTGNRAPIWLTLPVRMHRPLPADGVIRVAAAIRRIVAGQEQWSVHLALERAPDAWQTFPGPRAGRIALDIGWRLRPDGLRVAAWQNDAGQTGELVLPDWHRQAMQKVSDLQEIRDRLWNATLPRLDAWARTLTAPPDWLQDAMRGWRQWRRKGHLVRLYRHWRDHRFAGDEEGFALLDDGRPARENQGWYYREQHLYAWQEHLRDQALRRRREYYRVFAADLARRYAEVILEDFDLAQVARRRRDAEGQPGPAAELTAIARRHRQWAAVSELRQAVLSACQREGVTVTIVSGAWTTVTCHRCGLADPFDKRELVHRCRGCGAEWDQDENAAVLLLHRAMSGDKAA